MIRNLGFLYPGFFPDARIRILGALSGFFKCIYLGSTWSGEFLDAKIFPYKFRRDPVLPQNPDLQLNFRFFKFFSIIFFSCLDCYGVL